MTSKIRNWILNGELNKLRELETSNQPEKNELAAIINLSKNKGVKLIETILINRFPNAIYHYSENDKHNLITSLISEISEEIYSAGWYADIEFDLWAWVNDESTIPEGINHRVIKKDLVELQLLSNKLKLWAYWHEKYEEKSIAIMEWEQLYKRKKS